MKPGKATVTVLKRSVFKNIKKRRSDTLWKPTIGLDANGITMPDGNNILVSVATLTGTGMYIPVIAVQRALNNLYASQAKPYGITVSMTMPRNFEESMLKAWVKSMDVVCEEQGVDILGGQTTFLSNIKEPILTVNALGVDNQGRTKKKEFIANNQAIILTKYIGMEGTIRLASEKFTELNSRFTKGFIEAGEALINDISIGNEYRQLEPYEGLFLHDVAEGGIFGALWELSESLNCGIEIDLKKIPLKQETIEFCEFYDLNPYMLVSGGSTLIVTDQPNEIVAQLEEANIPGTIIGNVSSSNDKIIRNDGEIRYLEPFKGDEIYKVL